MNENILSLYQRSLQNNPLIKQQKHLKILINNMQIVHKNIHNRYCKKYVEQRHREIDETNTSI